MFMFSKLKTWLLAALAALATVFAGLAAYRKTQLDKASVEAAEKELLAQQHRARIVRQAMQARAEAARRASQTTEERVADAKNTSTPNAGLDDQLG